MIRIYIVKLAISSCYDMMTIQIDMRSTEHSDTSSLALKRHNKTNIKQ